MTEKITSSRNSEWCGVILGEAASKANSRKFAMVKGRLLSIKSDKARRYLEDFHKQCPTLNPMFHQNVSVEMTIYYASRRPDLDESLILDALQGKIYVNDRQVRAKHIYWGLDHERPRAEIRVVPLAVDQ